MPPLLRRSFILSLLLLSWAQPADATVMLRMDLHHLVGRSDQIFTGKVVSVKSRWTAGKRRIVTDAVIEVAEGVAGAKKGQRVTVTRLGGTVGEIGMRVAGSAVLAPKQRVMLFTELRRGTRYVVGMRQGLFSLYRADKQGQLMVRRQLTGLSLIDRKPQLDGVKPDGVKPTDRGLDLQQPMSLADMVKRVRAVVGECRAVPGRCQLRPR